MTKEEIKKKVEAAQKDLSDIIIDWRSKHDLNAFEIAYLLNFEVAMVHEYLMETWVRVESSYDKRKT